MRVLADVLGACGPGWIKGPERIVAGVQQRKPEGSAEHNLWRPYSAFGGKRNSVKKR
ncbi:MAG TPA: hypothetical protein VER12_15295 [Polyangiaceae bacterium]|nr:hypothetical protein [Polyangiaceae bacterium]